MGRQVNQFYRIGDWWVGKKPGREGYYRCRLDGRQVVRVKLGTSDLERAKELLTLWFLAQQQGQPGAPISLAEVLLAYEEARGKNVASASDVRISSRLWVQHFGDVAAVAVCEVERIESFKKWLLAKDYSPGYVNRVLSVGRAALMRAHERRTIAIRPVVKAIAGYRGPPKGKPLPVESLRKLYMTFGGTAP